MLPNYATLGSMHRLQRHGRRNSNLGCSSIVNSLRAAQIAGVGGLVQGRYVFEQGSPHAVQLEDVTVLTRPGLHLQNCTALVLLYYSLQATSAHNHMIWLALQDGADFSVLCDICKQAHILLCVYTSSQTVCGMVSLGVITTASVTMLCLHDLACTPYLLLMPLK